MYIFLLKLYRKVKKSENKTLVIKKYMYLFIFFGCISLPIGLWYPIRNYIEFKQPILYVMDPHNSDLYVGNYTLWQRFLPFSNEINQMYCDPWNQYNIPIFLLKCSLFGEYSWNTNGVFEILYATSIVLNIYLIFDNPNTTLLINGFLSLLVGAFSVKLIRPIIIIVSSIYGASLIAINLPIIFNIPNIAINIISIILIIISIIYQLRTTKD